MYAIYHGPLDLSEVLRREHLVADIFRTRNPKGHTGGESNRKWNRTTIVVVCNKATKKTRLSIDPAEPPPKKDWRPAD
jgi:hypothetical protein